MMRRLAILLAGCTAIAYLAVPQRSRAEIDADAGSAGGIAQCGELYSADHDPSGLWSRLDSKTPPPIKIVTTHVPPDGTGTKTRDGDDGIQIFWDPTQNVTKDGITAGPCEVLYHELQHAADDADDIPRSVLDDSCSANGTGNNGIPYAEWRAVGAENAYRASLGLPPRLSYNKTPFGFDKYSSFDDCKKKNQPPPGPANKPTNSVFGDPHLATTDGLLYDLQQVGEFTAFASGDSTSPRIQIRTAPVGDSKVASLVSAVAAGSGNQRIAFVTKDGTLTITHNDGTNAETITIDDGAQRDLGAGMTLGAAASTDFTGRAYTVRWAEGSQLRVNDAGYWGLRVSFEPSAPAKGAQPQGLLGNFNGDPADDLTRPDGRRVPPTASPVTIRSDFGDAWRISQADSLFPYAPGESTATFTDRAFPSAEPQLAGTDAARTVCQQARVMPAEMFAACVLDVSVTGNPIFAETAAAVARDVTIKSVAGQPTGQQQGAGTDFGAGRTVSGTVSATQQVTYQFSAQAGEVANIRSECTPSGHGFTYGIGPLDSSGSLVDPGGRDDGCTNLGRVAFATAATYQLVIIGDGQYRISWQPTPGDQKRTLDLTAPNVGHVSAATRQHLSFTVNPGQQWTFTPTAGCSQVPGFIWQVLDADGGSDGRGIYDGCQPIGPLTLAPGAYDVQIDAQSTDANYRFTVRSS
ncbi:MAG TPA: VWD domain-containing protein [Mycobacterium sp.]|nr:VWD domain-containing protein [Mycobacterium sp.]